MFGDHNISEERTLTNFFVYLALRPMQTEATSAKNSQQCWVLLANNVASVCMGLKV